MIPVIDLFAGPGGLGEGFSSLKDPDGYPIFQTVLSIEKDEQAHRTLHLRSYVRKILAKHGKLPLVYLRYMKEPNEDTFEALKSFSPKLWNEAEEEALCAELIDNDNTLVELGRKKLAEWRPNGNEPWVLIGGPPCQAYSLVGRSRRAHDKTKLDADPKQTLYKCYLAFIRELKPTVFVMENVRGLLSAQRKGKGVFDLICSDMRDAGYEIRSLAKTVATNPRDYIVEAERYGIPQKRHRVILLGVKEGSDILPKTLEPSEPITLKEALKGIPPIRSGFSERNRSWRGMNWKQYINDAIDKMLETEEGADLKEILLRVQHSHPQQLTIKNKLSGASGRYHNWYRSSLRKHSVLSNHESRTHLASDLDRYVFCAAYAENYNAPARITEFPRYLYPNHKNVQNVKPGAEMKFDDRFRVQLWDRPSTTVTSHIAKDGHYYIHPDPEQCRSLTVREAARLQTFPDDYFFEGNRTSQYTQVGNAVPPLLAQQIGVIVANCLGFDAQSFVDSLRSRSPN